MCTHTVLGIVRQVYSCGAITTQLQVPPEWGPHRRWLLTRWVCPTWAWRSAWMQGKWLSQSHVQGFGDLAETASMYTYRPQQEISDSLSYNICVWGGHRPLHCKPCSCYTALQDTWDTELIKMKCNVHPLDDVASSANKALQNYDKAKSFKPKVFFWGGGQRVVLSMWSLQWLSRGSKMGRAILEVSKISSAETRATG